MSAPSPRRVGRPRKDPAAKRRGSLLLKLTPAERELVDAAAGDEPVTVWAREAVLRAAKRSRQRSDGRGR